MAGPRFLADPATDRPSVVCEGLTILYHRPSGITHIIAEPVPDLLEALAEGPADAAELVARLARTKELAGEGGLEDIVAARLEELVAAGLVRRL